MLILIVWGRFYGLFFLFGKFIYLWEKLINNMEQLQLQLSKLRECEKIEHVTLPTGINFKNLKDQMESFYNLYLIPNSEIKLHHKDKTETYYYYIGIPINVETKTVIVCTSITEHK